MDGLDSQLGTSHPFCRTYEHEPPPPTNITRAILFQCVILFRA